MDDALSARWRRSTHCSGGSCVEIDPVGNRVDVRSSVEPEVVVSFTREAFRRLLDELRNG